MLRILAGQVAPVPVTWSPVAQTAVLQVRLPEILGALLVGGALASSGVAYQTMLRNPLVSPEVLGVAAVAVVVVAAGHVTVPHNRKRLVAWRRRPA